MSTTYPDILTPEQAADYLQVNRETIYRYIRDGRLNASRIGRSYRIRKQSLELLLASTATRPDSQVRIYSDEEIQTFLKDDALDDETKAQIEHLVCEHSLLYTRGTLGFTELSEDEKKAFTPVRQRLVRLYGGRLDWSRMSVVDMARAADFPALLVHDEDDEEIPFEHALALAAAMPRGELRRTRGYGHHLVLRSAGVIDQVVQFVASRED